MHEGLAELTEITSNGKTAGRIRCDPRLVPAPGQYLLALAEQDADAPLATPVFSAGPCPGGFLPAPSLPAHWLPGTRLHIRGPLGKGFEIPQVARFVALAAFGKNPSTGSHRPDVPSGGQALGRLLALMAPALAQNAAVVLLADSLPDGLPAAVEISPLAAFTETLRWADYVALDAPRDALPALIQSIRAANYAREGQVFIETPIPCGGMAECGVCAVSLRKDYKLACKDGPVFDLKTLLE